MSAKPAENVVSLTRRAKHAHQVARKGALTQLDSRLTQLEQYIMALDRRIAAGRISRRLQISLTVSILLHLLVIAFVTFKMPDKSMINTTQPMEVVLVNAKSKAKPVKANVHAQHNLDGGGNTDADRRAKSPLPVLRDDPRSSDLAEMQKRVAKLEQEARKMMVQNKSRPDAIATPPPTQQKADPQPDAPPSLSQADIQRSLNIQRLEASVAKDMEAYQKRPRRKSIGARAEEYRFARYIDDWRVKIERIGELNYPQAARDQKIYGSLLLRVSIKSDGAVDKIEIYRSSGHKILDDAAIQIVKLGAPYAPFPADIARDTDIIDISRTWRFTSTDRLETQ